MGYHHVLLTFGVKSPATNGATMPVIVPTVLEIPNKIPLYLK